MSDHEVIPVHVPSLVCILAAIERKRGVPLTRKEVLDLVEAGEAIALHRETLASLGAARGYDDIDPQSAWDEWQRVRLSLTSASDSLCFPSPMDGLERDLKALTEIALKEGEIEPDIVKNQILLLAMRAGNFLLDRNLV